MIAWILLTLSILAAFVVFGRRLIYTRQDLLFQQRLEEEEVAEKEANGEVEESASETVDEEENPELLGTVRKTFMKADAHFARNEFTDAESLFLAVIGAEADHMEAHNKLGLLYMKNKDFPNAELYFSKLVNLKKDPVYFSNLGASLYAQQRLIESAEAYENAVALDDRRAERLQSLAQIYYELGEDEKALGYFERASRRKPKDLELKLILADYYERMAREEDAVRILKEVLEADPYNEEVKARLKKAK
ncbi:MAG: tetratricopeptide repeat protein [Candidatus Gracilibacteria bacterium]